MDFFADIIQERRCFGFEPAQADYQIAFGIDARFAFGVGVCIASIIKNNADHRIAFHIFSDPLTQQVLELFQQTVQEHARASITIYTVDKTKFAALPTIFTWSRAIYYRFIAAKELCKMQRILYLDADILCLGSLERLFTFLPDDKIAAVVLDDEKLVAYAKRSFSFRGNHYFNSGVMLIAPDNWNVAKISEKALESLSRPNSYKLYDQDVLNVLLCQDTVFLPKYYNYIYPMMGMEHDIPSETILLHYSGSVKPWQAWGQFHFLTQRWLDYKAISPWRDVPILMPASYKDAKFMARTMKKLHKYPSYFKWLFYYGFWKLRAKLH